VLTDTQIKKSKPAEKSYKLSDSGGLFLLVATSGSKLWRLKYRFAGKEKLLSIGAYPDISLIDARAARDAAKVLLREHRDPGVDKKLRKLAGVTSAAHSFESVAREWHTKNKSRWSEHHANDVIYSMEKDVFPHLGSVPIRDITSPAVLAVLRLMEERPAIDLARRVRQRMSKVFVYGISSGIADNDPAAVVLDALLPLTKGRQPAITDLKTAKEIIAKVDDEIAHPVTRLAHRLLALTTVRPGTLTGTPWSEFADIDPTDPVWIIPSARMKLKKSKKEDDVHDHLVPLSRQALEVIAALRTLTGRGPLVFPNTRHAHKPMSENAIGYLLNRAGYHHRHVPHGWRSTFSTVMNEAYTPDRAVIDLMLAHLPKDQVEGAYNRAKHLTRRKELAQIWADIILEGAKPAAALLEGPRR
jgi:integrase